MRAYLLSDGEFQTTRRKEIAELLSGYLSDHGFHVEEKTIERDELAFCRGCFDCWTKTPGECVMRDGMTEINRACMMRRGGLHLSHRVRSVFGEYENRYRPLAAKHASFFHGAQGWVNHASAKI